MPGRLPRDWCHIKFFCHEKATHERCDLLSNFFDHLLNLQFLALWTCAPGIKNDDDDDDKDGNDVDVDILSLRPRYLCMLIGHRRFCWDCRTVRLLTCGHWAVSSPNSTWAGLCTQVPVSMIRCATSHRHRDQFPIICWLLLRRLTGSIDVLASMPLDGHSGDWRWVRRCLLWIINMLIACIGLISALQKGTCSSHLPLVCICCGAVHPLGRGWPSLHGRVWWATAKIDK